MDYSKYGIEDFLSDSSFIEYCLGTDDDAVSFWTAWLENHPEKAMAVNSARSLYFALNGNITDAEFKADYSRLKNVFDSRFRARQTDHLPELLSASQKSKWGSYFKLTGIAASVLLIAAFFIFRIRLIKSLPVIEKLSYENPLGQKRSIRLADGSLVILNGGSKLTLNAGFNVANREVNLEGEGYFEVLHNPKKPFIVHTHQITIKDIGTIFNVKAYPLDKKTEASLIKGSIEITLNNRTASKLVLLPSNKFIWLNIPESKEAILSSVLGHQLKVGKVTTGFTTNTVVETDWTQNKLSFYDQPLDEIALQMERWYGVKITVLNTHVNDQHFTGSFDHEGLIQVLNALKLSGNFNYRKEKDGISIY